MHRNSIDLKGTRILLVDDQPANLNVLCELLEPEGYRILMAPNGEIALKSAVRALPDLILLDVMMPGIDGYEVCRRLKQDPVTESIPVIFITANDQTEGIVAGFQAGGIDYIPKPFRNEEVLVRVRNALLTKYLFDQHLVYQEKMEKELQTAHDLQMGLMPEASPQLDGIDIAGRCITAEKVGGDFFQYFDLPQGGLAFSLVDVTGHAMEAAIPAVLFSGLLESQMERNSNLEEIFERLNYSACRLMKGYTHVCFAMAQLDPVTYTLRLSNGACPFPFHYRAATNEVVELEGDDAYPLGVSLDTTYSSVEIQLEPGDRVVFCSDGVMETASSNGEIFGFERTAELICRGCEEGLSATALLERIVEATDTFTENAPATDDRTCVIISVSPSA
ncbi:MAG: SpoIIE family protein phosphatase [Gemmatimonadetes bacterium]|nr:SpoIIE family protein phosphatase [Gemmatimonadota bacterium]